MSVITVKDVSRRFGGLQALSSVSFEVPEKSIVGLIGPNGAGKTTMFNIIACKFAPDTGTIHINGQDTAGITPHRVAALGIGRTFQLMRPFGKLTVLENLAVSALARTSNMNEAYDIARATSKRTGLDRYLTAPAFGLPTAGKKRLELARALATGASTLLLDEVLAGLVPSEREPIIELLTQLRADGQTILMVEHVMAAVMRLCDHVVVLHHGQVIARGTPQAVTADPLVIEAYLGSAHAVH